MNIDRALIGILEILSSSYYHNRNFTVNHSNHSAWVIELINGNMSLANCDVQLKQLLQKLIAQIPNPINDQELFDIWCKNNSKSWSDKLKKAIINSRNIGHDWNFSKEQMDILSEYFNRNVFFVNNLHGNPYIGNIFRDSFMKDLLLLNC